MRLSCSGRHINYFPESPKWVGEGLHLRLEYYLLLTCIKAFDVLRDVNGRKSRCFLETRLWKFHLCKVWKWLGRNELQMWKGKTCITCPLWLESVLLANLAKTHQARRELSAYQVERWNEFYHLLTKMTILASSFIWLINVMWGGTAAGPRPLLAGLWARWQNGRTWGEDTRIWRERLVAIRAHLSDQRA